VGQIDTVDSRTFKFSDSERFLGFDAIMMGGKIQSIAIVTLNSSAKVDSEGQKCVQPV
jgi:hypothetical protein